jgi:hypothetical protein
MSQLPPITLLGLGLGNFKNQFSSLPKVLRNPAKKFFDKFLSSSSWSTNFERDLSTHLGRKVGLFDAETFDPRFVKKYKEFFAPGAIIANLGTPVKGIKGKTIGLPVNTAKDTRMWENKLNEANFLKGILPETYSVPQLAKEFGINMRAANAGTLLQQAAKKKFGNKFLFKPITSYQTNPSAFPTQQSSAEELISTLRSGIRGNTGDVFGKGYKNWIVQKKLDLKSPNLLDRALGIIAPAGTGAREYRIHTLGNKVVPYASTYRGSARMVTPWATKEQLNAERHLQSLLSKHLDKRFHNTPFAFDVVIGKNGIPIPIEANPATLGGASGLVSTPHITDAILSHLGNKTPIYILRQRALEQTAKNTAKGTLAGASVLAPSIYSSYNAIDS